MTFERVHESGRSGQLLLRDGEPVAGVVWEHDFGERDRTGWFLVPIGADGEPEHGREQRLDVSEDVELLAADTRLGRADWIARAEAVELLTATAAVAAAERLLGGRG